VSDSTVRAFIEQATQALQSGQPGQALELAEQAFDVDSRSADAVLIRAIALSQLLRVEESTAAFEQAQALDPEAARISYNFAVHLHSVGNLVRAREEAERALRQTPNHQGARQLLALLDQQETATTERAEAALEAPPLQGPPMIGYGRAGYEIPEHSLRWVENLGPAWTYIGWGLAVLSCATALGYIGVTYEYLFRTLSNPTPGPPPTGPAITALSILGWTTIIGILFWTIADILDRRGNWFWIVPIVLCTCGCLNWAVLMLYIALGRNRNLQG
jgi:tetratricopeptide (TPR) repeat protein